VSSDLVEKATQGDKLCSRRGYEIYLDNKSAIELAKNLVHHERNKHIDVKCHFIREQVKEKKFELIHVDSEDQVTNIFTKSLPIMKFEKFKTILGMKDVKGIKFKGCVEILNLIM
jgi:hypothetical protein